MEDKLSFTVEVEPKALQVIEYAVEVAIARNLFSDEMEGVFAEVARRFVRVVVKQIGVENQNGEK